MEKLDWSFISALISVAVGWFLNELSQWFRTRKDDKKAKRQVLYHLLEAHHVFKRLDVSEFIDMFIERYLLRLPQEAQTHENKQIIVNTYTPYLQSLLTQDVVKELGQLEEKYINALDSLSGIDPITAYRLNGKTNIMKVLNFLQNYNSGLPEKFPGEEELVQNQIDATMDVMGPQIIKDANRDLEDEILSISCSISFLSWYKVRKLLKKSLNKGGTDSIREIDAIIDKIIPTLSFSKQ
jgi:hypothetical protein